MSTDRIEKNVVLNASRERVWAAISDSKQFGSWFGVAFDTPFETGKPTTGKLVGTSVDAEIAALQKPYEGLIFEFFVESIEPMQKFAFRWHPHAVDPAVDYSKDPTTLVAFELEEVQDGTKFTLTESGFDQIPLARRAEAFAANDYGWGKQLILVEKYLTLRQKER